MPVNTTGKRALIDKSNQSMVITLAIAGFLVVFSLVASRALFTQRNYQSRVIKKKEVAVQQLKTNTQAIDKLAVAYKDFVGTPDNVLGGSPTGPGDKDGDNAKIVLDALPSKYDFPALISSIEKMLGGQGVSLTEVSGIDEEVAQSQETNEDVKPVEMVFELKATAGSYQNVRDLLVTLEKSIRPIKATSVELKGGEGSTTVDVDVKAVSYYQAAQGLRIKKEVVN